MDIRQMFRKITSPRPRTIEVGAQIAAFLILIFGAISIWRTPITDLTQEKMLPLFNVLVWALGVASLLFLWAQLRLTATMEREERKRSRKVVGQAF